MQCSSRPRGDCSKLSPGGVSAVLTAGRLGPSLAGAASVAQELAAEDTCRAPQRPYALPLSVAPYSLGVSGAQS